ncbi:MAG: TerC family protein [Planctomycetaceae bacterium]
MEFTPWTWIGFISFLAGMLALDLGVFHRQAHVVRFREAMTWSIVWILLALGFAWLLFIKSGSRPAMEFLTGYVIEKSLSIDNVFVFAMLFSAMKVPRHCEHKVLFWGVFGALAMRVIMIVAGVAMIQRFHWLVHVFGGFLLVAAWRMLKGPDTSKQPGDHWLVRLSRRLIPVTNEYQDDRFFVRQNGRWAATPLLLVLILVEWSDLVFAVDSIPAIMAVSRDPFIVFTSNAFAILGLRSLYFALSGLMEKFVYLKFGLAGVLGFVGVKMMLIDVAPIPISISLLVVAGMATVSIVASLLFPPMAQTAMVPAVLASEQKRNGSV